MRNLIANNNQPQIFVNRVIFERSARDSECFDEPWNIFLRPYIACIQQKRVVDLISLEKPPSLQSICLRTSSPRIGVMMVLEERWIGRIVDQANAMARYAQN